jgi:pilus assembly protein CpaB
VDVLTSFNMDVKTFRPSVMTSGENGEDKQILVDEATNEGAVKVLLQDAQVLDIVKPQAPAPDEEAQEQETPPPAQEEPPTPQAQNVPKNDSATSLKEGNWVIVIGVTSQEAEVLRFALDRGIGISTMLRATGDHTTERTVGSTMRILIDNYGMPIPAQNPPVQQPGPVQIPNVPSLPEKQVETWAPSITAVPNQ